MKSVLAPIDLLSCLPEPTSLEMAREMVSGLWVIIQAQQETIRALRPLEQRVGEAPAGVVVSDRYAAYGFVDVEHRQVCWAHLLRDFERIAGRPGRQLAAYGYLIFRWRGELRPPGAFARLQQRIRSRLEAGANQSLCEKTAKTCRNLLNLWPALWHFLKDPAVPP